MVETERQSVTICAKCQKMMIAWFMTVLVSVRAVSTDLPLCSQLLMGQYRCLQPSVQYPFVMIETCAVDNSITVICELSEGIECQGMRNDSSRTFQLRIADQCSHPGSTDFTTALLLSIFLGWLGIDRIYLGYYAIGVLKMFSLGAFFVLYLADVVLIALQLLQPADGSAYSISWYGPLSRPVRFNNETIFASP